MTLKKLAAALSPVTLLNGLAASAPVATSPDIAFGPLERLKLDLYRPRHAGRYPVAVFFYGGGWEEGDRRMYRFVGAALASAGILTIIPDYRVFPEVRFPGFLEDAAKAVRWARDHAGVHGGDPERLVLIGHSAGAHIAAMLALDQQWLEGAGLHGGAVKGLVGHSGPYDFVPDTDVRRTIFGPEGDRARTQPISFARHDAPPAFLGTGRNDRVVDPGNSQRLAGRLTGLGAQATVKLYPRLSHEGLIGAFSPALRFLGPVFRDTVDFVEAVTAAEPAREEEAA